MISEREIQEARERISPWVERTPLVRSQALSDLFKTHVYLKLEIFQKTGSFKPRGAFNKMLSLTAEEKGRGVVAVSGGNHGRAVAFAAQALGVKALILMPENTSSDSIKAAQACGAQVILTSSISEAFEQGKKYEREGLTFVHPFDDPLIIAGQGTIGIELLEDLPDVTDVVVSIGGGGLISGVAAAIKARNSKVRIWGVETEGADAMSLALKAGHVVKAPAITSIAKTLGAPAVSERTLSIVKQEVEEVVVVSDAETFHALERLLEQAKLLTEPAASCTLAAVEHLRSHFNADNHVALVLCGGNVSLTELCDYKGRFAS